MKLTLRIKLRPLTRRKEKMLVEAMGEFKACVNEWLRAIDELGEKPNRGNLHSFAYRRIREMFSLHSNVIQDAMNLAIEIWRSWNKNGEEKPVFDSDCIYFKGVDVKIENDGLVVPLRSRERVYLPLYVRKYHRKYLQYKHGRVIIAKEGEDYYACISIHVSELKPYEPRGWLGVDIGMRHIIVVSDAKGKINKFYNNVIGWKLNLECRRAGLQRLKDKKVKKGAWRALKRLSGKIKNLQSNINHRIAKELVLMARERRFGIAIENLRGLRHGKVGKRHRKRLHKWAYRDLINKIVYKAKLHGVPVVFVNPKGSSRTCSRCGSIGRLKGRIFACRKCGLMLDRDLNAARNIAKRAFLPALKGEASSPQEV